jgi:hypothetical protein
VPFKLTKKGIPSLCFLLIQVVVAMDAPSRIGGQKFVYVPLVVHLALNQVKYCLFLPLL